MKVKSCINNNSELYGSCRHKPKFHRFNCLSSADEGLSLEISERGLTPPFFLLEPHWEILPIITYAKKLAAIINPLGLKKKRSNTRVGCVIYFF